MADGGLEDLLDELLSSDEDEEEDSNKQSTQGLIARTANVSDGSGKGLSSSLPSVSNGVSPQVSAAADPVADFFQTSPQTAEPALKSSSVDTAPEAKADSRPGLLGTTERAAAESDPAAPHPPKDSRKSPVDVTETPKNRSGSPARQSWGEEAPAQLEHGSHEPGSEPVDMDDRMDALSTSSMEADADLMPALVAQSSSRPGSNPPPHAPEASSRAPDEAVAPYVTALQEAEALERDLATGKGVLGAEGGELQATDPVNHLRLLLRQAEEPAVSQGLLGQQLLVRLETIEPLEEWLAKHPAAGEARSVASLGSLLAVGTSSGMCLVLMPRAAGLEDASARPSEVAALGQPSGQEGAAVTCLALSPQGTLLVAGHANGDLDFWELRRGAWETVKSVRDAHAAAVLQAAFLEGPQVTAVTGDARGRLVHHNVSAYLSLAAMLAGRLSKAGQPTVLTDGRQLGPVCALAGLPAGRSDAGMHMLESMLIICSAKGCYVGRVAPDGRLGVLHNIPRPPNAREGCIPYAAWRLLPIDPATKPRFAHAHLATAWGQGLYLMEVPIPVLPPSGENPPSEKPPVRLLWSWHSELPVSGVFWMEGPALAVVSQQAGLARLTLFSATGEEERDSLALAGRLIHHSDLLAGGQAPEACYHTAAAATASTLVLLGTQGLRRARLLGWLERLAWLREQGQYERALAVGLEAYQAATGAPGYAAAWRGEGGGAEPSQVAEVLAGLLGIFLEASLAAHSSRSAVHAAEVAVELCLALDSRSLLWSAVFPRFQETRQAAALLGRLLPHIFRDQLNALAPEVMQALVEHFAAEGQPQAIEAAVMHMAIASLDLNQVVRLCRQHQLYSALAFLFPRALLDHITPAAELAAAVALSANDGPTSRRLAYKLLVYLRLCFNGQAFPPGSGLLEPQRANEVKEQLLGLLLYGRPALLASLLEAGNEDVLQELLPGPHPVLRVLAGTDTGATLLVLREALEGCGLTDAGLRAAAAVEAPAAAEEVLAEQSVLDALVALADCGALEQHSGTEQVLDFVAEALTEGRVTAAPAVVLRLLRWLAHGPWHRPKPARSRESQFVALLQHLDLHWGRDTSEQQPAAQEARELARQAGFRRAEARVQQLLGDHAAALRCLLDASPAAAFDFLESAQTAADVWLAVEANLPELVAADGTQLAALVLRHFPERHDSVLGSLSDAPELQFRYLKGIMAADEGQATNAAQALLPGSLLKGRPAPGALQAQAQLAELFVSLLCRFEPALVLPFLQNNEAYRVQEVLPFCQEHHVLDAEAFLLERLGDVSAALDILVRQLDAALEALVGAALNGRIPGEELQRLCRTRAPATRLFSKSRGLPGGQPSAPEVPEAAARLRAAVTLCQRSSRDASQDASQELWLRVLRCCAGVLRQLRGQEGSSSGAGEVEASPSHALQRLLMHFLEDIIADWAGAAPLAAIGDRLLHEFAADCFGDFRGSLVGLLAAYNYELSILQAANRLMSVDAFRVLGSVYRAHLRAPAVEPLAGSRAGEAGEPEASSSSEPPPRRPSAASLPARQTTQQQPGAAHRGPLPGDPLPPPHRSGCDINFLRAHGLHSMID